VIPTVTTRVSGVAAISPARNAERFTLRRGSEPESLEFAAEQSSASNDPAAETVWLLDLAERFGLPVDLHTDEQLNPDVQTIREFIREVGRRGLSIKRFKGLGEMNPKELFETTMNPAKRKLLRIDLTDAIEAEDMFSKLMGDEVEPRRQFIEDNALNVRNLDV